jgi:hypothetical protein
VTKQDHEILLDKITRLLAKGSAVAPDLRAVAEELVRVDWAFNLWVGDVKWGPKREIDIEELYCRNVEVDEVGEIAFDQFERQQSHESRRSLIQAIRNAIAFRRSHLRGTTRDIE